MPDIGQPSASDKNSDAEIRDAIVSDATRFPGGFINERLTKAGAPVEVVRKFQPTTGEFVVGFDISSQQEFPTGLAFNATGTSLFVVTIVNPRILQYDLSTAFDISTATFNQSLDVSPQDGEPRGLVFADGGSRLYHGGRNNVNVYQYDLSTDFDISTATFIQSFDVSTQDGQPVGVAVDNSVTRLYVTGGANNNIFQYDLSTAFDISTATFNQSFNLDAQDGFCSGVTFDPDGSRLYTMGGNNTIAIQYDLSTAFDISTATFNQTLDVGSQTPSPRAVEFNNAGTRLYHGDSSDDNVFEYAVGSLVGEGS